MESGNERLAAWSGDRLRATLVLVHDGADSDDQRKHTLLSTAGVDVVPEFQRLTERIFRDRCGMASRRDDKAWISYCRPGRAPTGRKHLLCAGHRELRTS